MDYGLMTEPQLGMTYAELLDAARFDDVDPVGVTNRR